MLGFGQVDLVTVVVYGFVRAVVRSGVCIAFDEVCAVVVLNKNSVQVLGSVGQTVV